MIRSLILSGRQESLLLINFNTECIEEYINYYSYYIYYERISKLKEVIKKEDILTIIWGCMVSSFLVGYDSWIIGPPKCTTIHTKNFKLVNI